MRKLTASSLGKSISTFLTEEDGVTLEAMFDEEIVEYSILNIDGNLVTVELELDGCDPVIEVNMIIPNAEKLFAGELQSIIQEELMDICLSISEE